MKKSIYLFLGLLIFQSSCNKSADPEDSLDSTDPIEFEVEEKSLPIADNSETSLDWAGTYFEVLPCSGCEGIETWVTLKANGTFELKTNYLGLNDAREEIFTGNFSWDETGSNVTLEGLIGDYPGKFKVGENQIWYLDKNGTQISGELAERYILKKK